MKKTWKKVEPQEPPHNCILCDEDFSTFVSFVVAICVCVLYVIHNA